MFLPSRLNLKDKKDRRPLNEPSPVHELANSNHVCAAAVVELLPDLYQLESFLRLGSSYDQLPMLLVSLHDVEEFVVIGHNISPPLVFP